MYPARMPVRTAQRSDGARLGKVRAPAPAPRSDGARRDGAAARDRHTFLGEVRLLGRRHPLADEVLGVDLDPAVELRHLSGTEAPELNVPQPKARSMQIETTAESR